MSPNKDSKIIHTTQHKQAINCYPPLFFAAFRCPQEPFTLRIIIQQRQKHLTHSSVIHINPADLLVCQHVRFYQPAVIRA